jgi:hypothetical protein
MDEPPGGNPVRSQYSKAKKRREHRKRRLRTLYAEANSLGPSLGASPSLPCHDPQSSPGDLGASSSPVGAPSSFLGHSPQSFSEDHRRHLLRLETSHSLQLSVQAAKAEQDAARAQSAQEHLFFSSINASARDRQALADQHRRHLLLAEADHLAELAAQSARATQDAARAQAAEEQLSRGKETGTVVAEIAATCCRRSYSSTVTCT